MFSLAIFRDVFPGLCVCATEEDKRMAGRYMGRLTDKF